MNKVDIKKKFYKVVSALEGCSDTSIKNGEGVVIERGVNIDGDDNMENNNYITYGLEDNLIHLYKGSAELLKIDEESPIILMVEFALGLTQEY